MLSSRQKIRVFPLPLSREKFTQKIVGWRISTRIFRGKFTAAEEAYNFFIEDILLLVRNFMHASCEALTCLYL